MKLSGSCQEVVRKLSGTSIFSIVVNQTHYGRTILLWNTQCLSPFLVTTKMYPFTTDCNKLSATYSYVVGGIRMTRLIHVLCACGQPWGLHGCAVLMDHSGHSPLTLTHLIHEYHVDIPWIGVRSSGFCSATLFAKLQAHDVLFNKC